MFARAGDDDLLQVNPACDDDVTRAVDKAPVRTGDRDSIQPTKPAVYSLLCSVAAADDLREKFERLQGFLGPLVESAVSVDNATALLSLLVTVWTGEVQKTLQEVDHQPGKPSIYLPTTAISLPGMADLLVGRWLLAEAAQNKRDRCRC